MELRITEQVTQQDQAEIYAGLIEYNLPRLKARPKALGIYAEDAEGKKLAGLIGKTHGNWLQIKYLWVDQTLRGRKLGSRLLQEAENTASARGCKYAFVDTFSFQAPGFYRKCSYKEVLVLPEYPDTGARHYFTKVLDKA